MKWYYILLIGGVFALAGEAVVKHYFIPVPVAVVADSLKVDSAQTPAEPKWVEVKPIITNNGNLTFSDSGLVVRTDSCWILQIDSLVDSLPIKLTPSDAKINIEIPYELYESYILLKSGRMWTLPSDHSIGNAHFDNIGDVEAQYWYPPVDSFKIAIYNQPRPIVQRYRWQYGVSAFGGTDWGVGMWANFRKIGGQVLVGRKTLTAGINYRLGER